MTTIGDLASIQARIAELERRLADTERAHDADRRLTSYELHDGLVQYLAAALMQLESIDAPSLADPKSTAAIEKAADLLRRSITEARGLLRGLRLPVVEDGLAAAIGRLIEETLVSEGVATEYTHDLPTGRLDPLVEGMLYRIAQESFNNIFRHSAAKRAQVILRQESDRVRLIVRDWGQGFEPAAVAAHRFGLVGIRKRAELAAGSAVIESKPGEGTKVTVELPYGGK